VLGVGDAVRRVVIGEGERRESDRARASRDLRRLAFAVGRR